MSRDHLALELSRALFALSGRLDREPELLETLRSGGEVLHPLLADVDGWLAVRIVPLSTVVDRIEVDVGRSAPHVEPLSMYWEWVPPDG